MNVLLGSLGLCQDLLYVLLHTRLPIVTKTIRCEQSKAGYALPVAVRRVAGHLTYHTLVISSIMACNLRQLLTAATYFVTPCPCALLQMYTDNWVCGGLTIGEKSEDTIFIKVV